MALYSVPSFLSKVPKFGSGAAFIVFSVKSGRLVNCGRIPDHPYLRRTEEFILTDNLFVLPVGPKKGQMAPPMIFDSSDNYVALGLSPPEEVCAHD